MTEERRLVTVLFADVVGSTALGESLDPEDVRALLNRFFAISRDAIEQRGGRLEKFIGDAVMAVFGLPVAHDDDPARALSAALDLRDKVRADPILSERLPIRLGVNGGEVIATRGSLESGGSDFLITGDAVNSAARLQQGAEAWGILVGERTARAVGDAFELGPRLAIDAKGKAAPIAARSLVGVATSRGRARRTAIVGRDADLLQLQLVERRVVAERRPYLVNVVAPAGVGKSRLLEEFLDQTRRDGVVVAMAQCLPYGQRLTYWPMRALLLAILDLPDGTAPDALREELHAWLEARGEPNRQIGELIAATVGANDTEASDRIALFAAWRRFVELAAESKPLILIVEDLHWSSDSLLDLVESILQPRVDVPLMMIALTRPELLDRRPSWGGGRRNAVSIALEPLADADVEALVANLLEMPAPDIVAAVVRRAEGNPFYAGEIVRSLIDQLGDARDPEAVASALAGLPDTVHGTVLARLDALEPATRRVIQLGSVLGRSFYPDAITALEPDLSSGAVDAAIDGLLQRDLVRPSAGGMMTVRHILIREVAYGMLPRAERSRLHAAAAAWLEARAVRAGREDELAELVAFHLREAATLSALTGVPADPALNERAVAWLRRAADAANAGAATVEAARHLEAAVELAPIEVQPELYEALAAVWVGGDQAVEALARAEELGRSLELGPEQAFRVLAKRLLVASRWIGSVSDAATDDEIRAMIERLRSLAHEARDERALAIGLMAEAFLAGVLRDPRPEEIATAMDAAAQALERAERLRDSDLQSAALDALTTGAAFDDRPRDALVPIRRRLALDGLATSERLDAQIMLSWTEWLLGDFEVSESAAAAVRDGLAAGQAPAWVLGASGWRTLALWALGRWDDAMVEAGRTETAWRESEIRAPSFALNGFLSAFLIAEARHEAVDEAHWRSVVETILERVDSSGRVHRMAAVYRLDLDSLVTDVINQPKLFFGRLDYVHLALARVVDHRHAIPEERLATLADYAQGRELRFLEALARRGLGVLHGRTDELQTSLAMFRAMRSRPFIARAQSELGRATGDIRLAEEGIAELEQLGDRAQIERIVRASAE